MTFRRVRQEAGVDIFQVWATGANWGHTEGITTVSASLIRSVVGLIKWLRVRARCPCRSLSQLPTAHREGGEAGSRLCLKFFLFCVKKVVGCHSLAPALHDATILLGSQCVSGRLRQRLNLTGQVIAAEAGIMGDVSVKLTTRVFSDRTTT